ncbi:hypothetical protein [Nocardia sp. NPDC127526]
MAKDTAFGYLARRTSSLPGSASKFIRPSAVAALAADCSSAKIITTLSSS